jgi:phosphoribosylformylglycinamidine synthase
MKVETHNHPTAISPFPGASTGAGGEIRDEGATGRGSKPKAGLTGFTVSKLWGGDFGKPEHIASPLQIMVEGPLGGAAFNNEFGRPNLLGYFREYEQSVASNVDTVQRGYHKPIMIAGGLGVIDATQTHKIEFPAGSLLIQLGGPGMRIGMGGSAASSMATGANAAELDFDSVQRGNPEIERRAQEVINQCWMLGNGGPSGRERSQNPILAIHDVGAGRPVQRLPRADQRRRPWRPLRFARRAARRIRHGAQGNLVQREPGALCDGDCARVAGAVHRHLRARALPVCGDWCGH